MRLNIEKYEALIQLAARPRRGIWAASTLFLGQSSSRNAGQAPTTSSAHSLLATATIASLKAITRKHIERLARRDQKLRVQVITLDRDFAEAMTSLQQPTNPSAQKPWRAGKNLIDELMKQLSRFDVTFTAEPDDKTLLALGTWGEQSLPSPKKIERLNLHPLFMSQAVSELLPA
jgi:hypothetical protein